MKFINRFIADDNGTTSIEYGVLAGFLSIMIVAGAYAIGENLVPIFDQIAEYLRQ
ncbi:Flp family type IVb pilin [Hyphomicrobium sulfonivorans]|uniref:Flp family type IVb pilin n=1 Tax=Hyphomicrobium sulfonivorans TaxID=121290 RepID=UPI00156FE979|nr:Flp family type IVb pilin [Hyphomicrobium sulfonivorans]NSL72353.1 Flp family type IVb pilin [Hyphomicrobium sulfonivorans]